MTRDHARQRQPWKGKQQTDGPTAPPPHGLLPRAGPGPLRSPPPADGGAGESGLLPASQLLWEVAQSWVIQVQPRCSRSGSKADWAGRLGPPAGWISGWGALRVFLGGVYVPGTGAEDKEAPSAFTVHHHRRQQALLLAAQPVLRLALLVPEAGQALGAGQVLAGGMLHVGTQAVRPSRPGARGREHHVNRERDGGGVRFCVLARRGGPGKVSAATPSPPHTHTHISAAQSHADARFTEPSGKRIQKP